jgi:hypothetical protein
MTNYQIEGFAKWLILITVLFTVMIIAFIVGWTLRDIQYKKTIVYLSSQKQTSLMPSVEPSTFIIPEPSIRKQEQVREEAP